MAALPAKPPDENQKKLESSIDVQSNDEKVSFIAPEFDGKRWHFKKNGTNITFYIGEENKGNIRRITVMGSAESVDVLLEKDKLSVDLTCDSMGYFKLAAALRNLANKTNRRLFVDVDDMNLMTLMLAYFNGRCNFDYYSPPVPTQCPESCEEITREVLVKILKRENEIRLSKQALESLERESCEYENNKMERSQLFIPWSIEQCQIQAVKEFGYKSNDEIDYAIQMLRSARALFPKDLEIQNSTFYLKYNRARRGELQIGDTYKDVPLMTCGQESINLSDVINTPIKKKTHDKTTIIINGSVT